MKYRNPFMVIIFSIITFGIFSIAWSVMTKDEMNAKGAHIPTAWLIIIPIISIYWMWKYSEGVEVVTTKEMESAVAFLLLFFLGVIGMAIIQDKFNKVPKTG